MNSPHGTPDLPYCRNCHYTLTTPRPRHCGHCGQETDLHPPSVREMVTEYVGHYVALDGPLWRTLWALAALPGHLTNAYFHGQRRRYVLPLRVYLSASFVFFLGWALLPQGASQIIETPTAPAQTTAPVTVQVRPGMTPAQAAAAADAIARGASAATGAGDRGQRVKSKFGRCELDRPDTCTGAERWLTRVADKAEAMTFDEWKLRARGVAPYAMLLMQPVLAALLLLALLGSGRRYAEHFVFSLHSHSLWFLALLLGIATHLEGPVLMAVFGHGLVAMRRVYALHWWGTVWRAVLVSVLYFVLLGVVALGMAALIALTA